MRDMALMVWVKAESFCRARIARTAARFHRDTRGGIAEYAVVVGLAVVFGIAMLTLFWERIQAFFGEVADQIMDILGPSGP